MSIERIVIVGAGVTGLTAAALLQEKGRQVVLLEAADQVGGLCRSITLDSVVFDLGPHLFLANQAIESHRFIMDLLARETVVNHPFHFAIQARGRYWIMPLNLPDIALHFPWSFKKELVLARLGKNPPSPADPRSLRHLMEGKAGPSYYRDVFGPFIQSKTGMDGDILHQDWAKRVDRDVHNRNVPFSGLTHRVGLGEKLKATFFPRYHYPLRGFAAIAEELWRRFTQAGGQTVLSCGPLAIAIHEARVAAVQAQGQSFPADQLVWTASVNDIHGLLGAPARPLPYADNYIILLTYQKRSRVKRPFAYTYHTDPGLVFNRLYYPDNLLGPASPAHCEGICAEILASESLDGLGQEEIVAATCQGIERLGLFSRQDLREARVIHLKDCMPVYPLDYEQRMEQALATVHGISNLHAVGRRGGYFFCQTPAAVEQGMKVARHILQARP